ELDGEGPGRRAAEVVNVRDEGIGLPAQLARGDCQIRLPDGQVDRFAQAQVDDPFGTRRHLDVDVVAAIDVAHVARGLPVEAEVAGAVARDHLAAGQHVFAGDEAPRAEAHAGGL